MCNACASKKEKEIIEEIAPLCENIRALFLYNTSVPEILKSHYNDRSRIDGKPGFLRVVPTSQRFVEADQTDVRLSRVYVCSPDGTVERTYLEDMMFQRFVDNDSTVIDDPNYLRSLKG